MHLNSKLCFYAGVTGSGFPFDFGRAPYKGKRPLKDMIGSYKNRHGSGDPSTEGTWGSGGNSKLASEMQLQVQSQQEELEQLKKDLSSQKVTSLIPPDGWGPAQSLASGLSESFLCQRCFLLRMLCATILGTAILLGHLRRDFGISCECEDPFRGPGERVVCTTYSR